MLGKDKWKQDEWLAYNYKLNSLPFSAINFLDPLFLK